MDRLPSHGLVETVGSHDIQTHALAYDRRFRNRRPVYELLHRLERNSDGAWIATREWRAAGAVTVASETVEWQHGLVRTKGHSPSLAESFDAQIEQQACHSQLTSQKTLGQPRHRTINLPHAPVTSAAMPLFIAQHWAQLCAGQAVDASYLVPKVQRAATVRVSAGAANAAERVVDVTPRNLPLRALFGMTRFVFAEQAPLLRRIQGLLDPRDLKPNGRWIEYLGTVEFDKPVDLSGLMAARSP